jgi:hypothetical protein
MKKILVFLALCLTSVCCQADQMAWDTPYGTFGLPLNATEVLLGYDGILKQAIGGASVPFYTDPKGIVTASVGAVAPWPNRGAFVEPYLGLGHDMLKEIPGLNQFTSAHLNIFARYAATQGGKFGAGLSFSYAFAGGALVPPPQTAPPPPPPPQVSKPAPEPVVIPPPPPIPPAPAPEPVLSPIPAGEAQP